MGTQQRKHFAAHRRREHRVQNHALANALRKCIRCLREIQEAAVAQGESNNPIIVEHAKIADYADRILKEEGG